MTITHSYTEPHEVSTRALVEKTIVGGVDITKFRDVRIPDLRGKRSIEPYGYGATILTVPQVNPSVEAEHFGSTYVDADGETQDLTWVREGLLVVVQACDPVTGEVDHVRYRGCTDQPSDQGTELVIPVGGLVTGRAEQRDKQVPVRHEVVDIGRLWWEALDRRFSGYHGVHFTPKLGPTTGITIAEAGGGGMTELDWMNQLAIAGVKRNGDQWTCMPSEPGGNKFEVRLKDTTTVDYTVWIDGHRAVADLKHDPGFNMWFLNGVREDGGYWDGTVFPGVIKEDTPPDFPGVLSEGSSGDAVSTMHWKLIQTSKLDADEATSLFDQETTDAILDVQEGAGLPETGIVDQATWDALYDVGVTGWSLGGAHIEPLVQDIRLRKWLISAAGNYLGRNPKYDRNLVQRHRTVPMGYGFTMRQGINWAKGQMARIGDNAKTGTITLNGVTVFAGDWAEDATPPASAIVPGRDIQAGGNIRVHFGGDLVHVASVDVDPGADGRDTVTLGVDSGWRDWFEIQQIIRHNKESKNDSRRKYAPEFRSSKTTPDRVTPWHIKAGINTRRHELEADTWYGFWVFAGGGGDITRFRLVTESMPAETCGAIWAKHVPLRLIQNKVGDPFPLDANGKSVWADPALEALFRKRHVLYAWGNEEQPGGYWPGQKTNRDREPTGDPLNGVWQDDGTYPFHTFRLPALWITVRADRDTVIEPARILRAQLGFAA